MANNLLMKAIGGCGLAFLLTGASAQDPSVSGGTETRAVGQAQWPYVGPPDGTVAVPVRVSKALPADATHLKVCFRVGGRTRTYQVLTRGCSDRANYCTVFAAVPLREDMAFLIYDVGEPPFAVAEDDVCTEPDYPTAAVLSPSQPSN